jgi:hypothetical protein
MSAVVVLASVTLNAIGAPPVWTVVGPCAVMVTSMPPADPCDVAWGPGEVDVVTDGLDGDADCPAVVVAEGVVELVVVLGCEQPASATTVAAPTNVAARLEAIFMTSSAMVLRRRSGTKRRSAHRYRVDIG